MKNSLGITIVVAVVVGGLSFWAGMSYAGSSKPTNTQSGAFVARNGGAFGRGGGVFGTIIAKDSSSITVQLGGPNATSTNGNSTGSKIVFYNPSTQIEKIVSGSVSDLSVGQMVMVAGSANQDGSVTAQNIQIRPAGSFGRGQ